MRSRHGARVGTILAVCSTSLALAVPAGVAVAATRTPAARPQTVLVFLRGPASRAAGRRDALGQFQTSAVSSFPLGLSGDVVARTLVPDTLTMHLTTPQLDALRLDPSVAQVVPDVTIQGPTAPYALDRTAHGPVASGKVVAHASCGTAAHPQLNPEALTNINAPAAWSQGATGKGVKVAFLADGLDISNPDLRRNAAFASAGSHAGTPVITSYQDFSGDGTAAATDGAEAFGDAASIAAQGNTVYDLSRYVSRAHPLPRGCDIRVIGAAPGATVLALKVYSQNNTTTASGFVQAINYAVANGAKVINESFGGNNFPDTATDVIRAADDAAVAAGVTVVASSGDAGISSTIGSPATDPNVIAVGATTTFRAYEQDTFGGINAPGANGHYVDNNISSLSSGGFAQDAKTVNLVAPGDLGWALCSSNATLYTGCASMNLQDFGGTSQASPLTAGAAADVIGAYEATHHGASPTPALVERILTSSATDIAAPAEQQGAGLLNIGAAVRLARSIAGTVVAKTTGGILADTAQLNLSGAPRSTVHQAISLTNTASTATTVSLSTRVLQQVGSKVGAVALNPAVHTSQPKLSIWSGALEVYQRASFKVPSGLNRLKLDVAYLYNDQTSLLHVALFGPGGTFEGYSLPQGQGNYGDVEVATPTPGTWSAVFFTVWNGYGTGNEGTSGPVHWDASFWRDATNGSVTPHAVVIPPHASRTVQYRAALPSSAGDTSASIVVRSTTTDTTIPVTLRTDIAITQAGGTFHGVLTGGNGRDGAPGQTNTYAFSVPAGKTDLDASLAMARNPAGGQLPGDQVVAMLVDPTGQVAAYDSNFTTDGQFNDVVTRYVNLYKADPAAGEWLLVLEWAQPGAGVDISIPFSGAIRFDQVTEQNTLPDSPSATVSATTGGDFEIKVTNNGVAPMLVSPDARLSTEVAMPLVDAEENPATQSFGQAQNVYFVPTETSSLTVSVAGSVPATFDTSTYTGDPDISPTLDAPYVSGSVTPTLATATFTPPTGVTPGIWNVVPSELGPYGAGAEPAGTETTTATATALAFDPTVTSTVPDTVEALTEESGSISPDAIGPGSWDLISIHIAPTASVGTVVSGTLFINGLTTGSFFGDTIANEGIFTSDLAILPYEYTVGT